MSLSTWVRLGHSTSTGIRCAHHFPSFLLCGVTSMSSTPLQYEVPPCFPPTYKFDKGVPVGPGGLLPYDSSEKRRIPAWTDRCEHPVV